MIMSKNLFLRSLFFIILLLINAPTCLPAQSEKQQTDSSESIEMDIDQITQESIKDVERQRYELENAKYNYEVWVINYTKRLYTYQFISSIILLFVAISILICGLWFSYLQFKNHVNNIPIKKIEDVNKAQEIDKEILSNTRSTLKLSVSGLEISSSIIGLLILCLSLGFFYLYIANIYPIIDSDGNLDKLPNSHIEDPNTSQKTPESNK